MSAVALVRDLVSINWFPIWPSFEAWVIGRDATRVGRRLSAPQIVWNKSTRRAGARGEAGSVGQMAEYFDNHWRCPNCEDNSRRTIRHRRQIWTRPCHRRLCVEKTRPKGLGAGTSQVCKPITIFGAVAQLGER